MSARTMKSRTKKKEADKIYQQLPDRLQKAVDLTKVKEASTQLTVLPLTEHGFKSAAFHDALPLWYGWTLFCLPSKCECGNSFNVEHVLFSAKGGFLSLRHNEI